MTRKRNKPDPPPVNRFPNGSDVDLDTLGRAATRILTEQALEWRHGVGDAMWKHLDVTAAQFAKQRDAVVDVLRRILLEPAPRSTSNRSGAAALLGELGDTESVPALVHALRSQSETASARAWAAAALGCIGGDDAVAALITHVDDPSPIVRQGVVNALAASGSKDGIGPLCKAATEDCDPVVSALAYESVRALERELGLPPAPLDKRRQKRPGRGHTVPTP